jgi:hypothetical protein
MATVEDVMRRLLLLEQETLNLRAEAAQARQEAAQANQRAAVSDQVVQRLTLLPGEVAAAIAAATRAARPGRQLVDPKGLGKPPFFTGNESEFAVWCRKTENSVLSVYPEAVELMRAAVDSQKEVNIEEFQTDMGMPKEIIDEVNAQVYSVMMALTSNEPFDIVVGAGAGNGLETWRRLHRRYDPGTVGRSRGMLRDILSPAKSNIESLRHNVEKLEEKIRRYCERRDASGGKMTLNEDIRMASLEALLPDDLEKHVQLNRGRLTTYETLRGEVVMYAEARGTSVKPPRESRHDDPMDTSSMMKGKAKGKGKKGDGKGKGSGAGSDKECYNCGKKGHFSKDCWAPKKVETAQKTQLECYNCNKKGHMAKDCWVKSNAKGKGKGGKGKETARKSTNALEDETPEPEKEVGMLDMFDVGAMEKEPIDATSWVKINLDTGAARTVFPENVKYGERKEEKVVNFKTATGEVVPSSGGLVLIARDEWGRRTRCTGALAPVHKPLLAAGQVTDKGNSVWLSGDRGYIVEKGSYVQKCVQKAFDEAMKETSGRGTLEVYKENGIYNLYMQVDVTAERSEPGVTLDLSAGASQGSRVDPRAPGGFQRQGRSL